MMKLKPIRAVRLACPKHRRFDPAIKGYAGVKENCRICAALCDAQNLHDQAERAIAKALSLVSLERQTAGGISS